MYSSGVQGGVSYTVPRYFIKQATSSYSIAGANPIDNVVREFRRITGQQIITGTVVGGTSWVIEVEGGYDASSTGYVGNYVQSPPAVRPYYDGYPASANYMVTSTLNCTVVGIALPVAPPATLLLNGFTITNTTDNRTYELWFSPFVDVLPTIECTSNDLGADVFTLDIEYNRFQMPGGTYTG